MKRVAALAALLLVAGACAKRADTRELDAEIARVKSEIVETRAEQARYDPSLVRSLVSLRLAIQEQSLAMLEQKRASRLFYVNLSYTIDGRAHSTPDDRDLRVKALSTRLDATRTARENAGSSTTESATHALAVAQLGYEIDALRFGFPAYVARSSADEESAEPVSTVISAERPKIDEERGQLRAALDVKLVEKSFVPKESREKKSGDKETFRFRYRNGDAREIGAFGGALVFSDLFDHEFFRVALASKVRIAPRGTETEDQTIELDLSSPAHERIATGPLEEMKVRFEPGWIAFSDGSRLGSVARAGDATVAAVAVAPRAEQPAPGRATPVETEIQRQGRLADEMAEGQRRRAEDARARHMHEGPDGFMRCDPGYVSAGDGCRPVDD